MPGFSRSLGSLLSQSRHGGDKQSEWVSHDIASERRIWWPYQAQKKRQAGSRAGCSLKIDSQHINYAFCPLKISIWRWRFADQLWLKHPNCEGAETRSPPAGDVTPWAQRETTLMNAGKLKHCLKQVLGPVTGGISGLTMRHSRLFFSDRNMTFKSSESRGTQSSTSLRIKMSKPSIILVQPQRFSESLGHGDQEAVTWGLFRKNGIPSSLI